MSTIPIATLQTSKARNKKIIHTHPRSKYPPPPHTTNELLLCVPEQTTETTFTYVPHYRQWDALDCCYSLQNGPCCPPMICSATLPPPYKHRSAINRSGDVEGMNFSSWSSNCSFRMPEQRQTQHLGKAASTSRPISSVSLKWWQYTIWFFGRLLFMIHKHSFAVLAVPLQ